MSADGSTPHPIEAGRFHLFVAHNCGWSHRALIVRNLMKLHDAIGISVAHFRRSDDGWWFPEGLDELEPIEGRLALHRVYTAARSDYTGSATVPVLWDRRERTIVNNESSELVRMLEVDFAPLGDPSVELYPEDLRAEIDSLNSWIYPQINDGVYRCGFAGTQAAYDEAFHALFEGLDRIEEILGRRRYLAGGRITEADVRLFPTLVRFDAVYHSHFKCNRQRIADYPHLSGYTRDLFQTPGFGETVEVEIYKKGYMGNSMSLNPRRIIGKGPLLDFESPHDRATRDYSEAAG